MTLLERLREKGACEEGLRALRDLPPEKKEALERDFLAQEIRISSLPEGLLGYLSWALEALGPEFLDRDQAGTTLQDLSLRGKVESLDFSDSRIETFDLQAAEVFSFFGTRACLGQATLVAARMISGDFSESRIQNLYVNFSHVFGASFMDAILGRVQIEASYLGGVSFTRARIEELSVEGASIDGASFSEARVHFDAVRTKFSGCYLGGARISGTFRYCQFSDVHWPEDLSQVEFVGCEGAPK